MDRSQRFRTNNQQKSKTNQRWKDKADIKHIVKMNRRASIQQHNPNLVQQRTDVIETFDTSQTYHDQMNQCRNFTNEFNRLPGDVQQRFDHNPGKLIDFVRNPENNTEAIKLGLLPKPSTVKYVNKDNVDITEDVYKKKGIYIDGVRVDKKGRPLVYTQTGDLSDRDGNILQTKAELDLAKGGT